MADFGREGVVLTGVLEVWAYGGVGLGGEGQRDQSHHSESGPRMQADAAGATFRKPIGMTVTLGKDPWRQVSSSQRS